VGVVIPANLVAACERDGRDDWLSALPVAIRTVARRWSLALGPPFEPGGETAWVAPARTPEGHDVVVKVAWRHFEAEHEAVALRVWDGNGAVRVFGDDIVDERTSALLLERCRPGTTLAARPAAVQDDVVARLLPRLWHAPRDGVTFRPLQTMCDAWADEFEEKVASGRFTGDAGIARDGAALFRALPASAPDEVLLCTDLHAGNVLAARREPWLAIDPKPYAGDPTYDALQHMLNSRTRLDDDPVAFTTHVADLLALDETRLRRWLFARCVIESATWPALVDVARRLVTAL